MVDMFGGNAGTGVWKWSLLQNPRLVVPEGQLTQTFSFATREDGLDIDKFAFALAPTELDRRFHDGPARRRGRRACCPVRLPDPYRAAAGSAAAGGGGFARNGSAWCVAATSASSSRTTSTRSPPRTAASGARSRPFATSTTGPGPTRRWRGGGQRLSVPLPRAALGLAQQPDWIETLPPEEQLAEIREWFEAVNERYGQRIQLPRGGERVRQPAADRSSSKATTSRRWAERARAGSTGSSRLPHGAGDLPPSVKLMLNEYSVINTDERAPTVPSSRRTSAGRRSDRRDRRAGAMRSPRPARSRRWSTGINQLARTGLPLYLTEMDIDGPPGQQLIDFQRLFPAFWENPNIHGITLWGYRDGIGAHRTRPRSSTAMVRRSRRCAG